MAKKLSGLGRGLDALFPSDFDALNVANGSRPAGISEIAISDIKTMKSQPRTLFDEEKIEQLSSSIKQHGVLQPIVVVERSGGVYEIIAGERRYRAARDAGLKTIPAVVRTVTDLEQLEIALVENIQRVDLDAIEQAISIRRLHEDFSQSYEMIAKKLGKAESTVVNLSRLLQLPGDIQQALRESVISEGHARSLLSLQADPVAQKELFLHIINDHWSVRKAELFVKSHKQDSTKAAVKARLDVENESTKSLEKKWGRQVRIQRTAKGGKLTIRFNDDKDLEALLHSLDG